MFPNGVDIGVQMAYLVTDSSKADRFLLSLAVVGVGLEFVNPSVDPTEVIAAGYKTLLVKSPKHAQLIRESAQGLLDDILAGRSVGERIADLKVYAKLLKNPDGLVKLLDEGGTEALSYAKRMAGKYPTTVFDWVREPKQFFYHWVEHRKMWEQLGITTEAQFQNTLEEVIKNGRKVIYQHPTGSGYENRFGFYDEARNIFVAAKEDGRLWTAFRPGTNWWNPGEGLHYVMDQKWALEIK